MQRIGNGYEGLRRLLILLNHPLPLAEKNYRIKSYAFNKIVMDVTETVMQDACNEIS